MKTDILLITPGERVDVLVAPKGKPGAPLAMRAMLYNRGYGSVEFRAVEDVLTIEFTKEPPLRSRSPSRCHARIARRRRRRDAG